MLGGRTAYLTLNVFIGVAIAHSRARRDLSFIAWELLLIALCSSHMRHCIVSCCMLPGSCSWRFVEWGGGRRKKQEPNASSRDYLYVCRPIFTRRSIKYFISKWCLSNNMGSFYSLRPSEHLHTIWHGFRILDSMNQPPEEWLLFYTLSQAAECWHGNSFNFLQIMAKVSLGSHNVVRLLLIIKTTLNH